MGSCVVVPRPGQDEEIDLELVLRQSLGQRQHLALGPARTEGGGNVGDPESSHR